MALKPKTRIAHLAGPTATIQNTPPLVTSNKARAKLALPPLKDAGWHGARFDVLRAQRLAAPGESLCRAVLRASARSRRGELYGPPDGYIGG